jgi:hypothetical protein
MLLVINEDFVKEEHICWQVDNSGDGNISLYEVVNRTYRHPEAPEDAFIKVIEVVLRSTVKKNDSKAAPMFLLANAEENLNLLRKGKD